MPSLTLPNIRPTASHMVFPVAHDVAGLQTQIVNLYFVGDPTPEQPAWVMVDAGMYFSAGKILRAAEERFGQRSRLRLSF